MCLKPSPGMDLSFYEILNSAMCYTWKLDYYHQTLMQVCVCVFVCVFVCVCLMPEIKLSISHILYY